MMKITIPNLSLVVLIGCSSSGKTTFARKHFKKDEIISVDTSNESLINKITKRLEDGLLTVIDATNLIDSSRKVLINLAYEYNISTVAIVLNTPEKECLRRNKIKEKDIVNECVIKNQTSYITKSIKTLETEGFEKVYVLNSVSEIDDAIIEIISLKNNLKNVDGPFDIIGDIHGCYDELLLLIKKLGYQVNNDLVYHNDGRKLIFLGDLVDRGPKVDLVLKLVMNLFRNDLAYIVSGNHDIKLVRLLDGKNVKLNNGLQETVDQLKSYPKLFIEDVKKFLEDLESHYVFDHGNLVVAHAGLKEEYHGRESKKVKNFAYFGDTTGKEDEYGFPIRLDWAANYKGKALVVYGHTPVQNIEFINNTVNIDTGCVFGGKLSALRYPEKEIVSVDAIEEYAEYAKPIFINNR